MRLPVLTYHAVLPVERTARIRGTVPLPVFRDQVRWLVRRGYRSLTLDEAADLLQGSGAAPRRAVVFTFDDGYRCVVDHALDVLEEAGFRATLFVVTDAVGLATDWYVPQGGVRLEHAAWDALERARARGFEIGSHGVTHRPLTELGSEEQRDELERSRAELEKRLGRCAHFAYPYGAVSEEARAAVRRAGYRTACTTRRGLNRAGQPLEALLRQSISRTTSAARFRRRVGAWW